MSTSTYERLRVLFSDTLGKPRGKYVPWREGQSGVARFCRSLYGVTFERELIPFPGACVLENLPDLEVQYRAEDVRGGWDAGTRVVLGDQFDNLGAPLALDPRGALKRAIADWQALGYTPMVGIELEAYAFVEQADGSLVPYGRQGSHVYDTGAFADPLGVMDAIWDKAAEAGFQIDSMNTEYDAFQWELTLRYDEALRATDDIFLFRLLAREEASRHGVVLTFMPKPIADSGGSGVHINFSLRDAQGRNAFAGGVEGNALMRGCVAGLMQHHAALAGLVAPTAQSYQRLQPASLSGYWQNWAVDHRGVTVRVSPETGEGARIEHRMPDAGANPYTTVAAILQAARLGVTQGYPLQAAEQGDCLEHNDAKQGVAENLAGALDALEADAALVQAVGAELVANHLAAKRYEAEKTADLDGEALRDFYIRHI